MIPDRLIHFAHDSGGLRHALLLLIVIANGGGTRRASIPRDANNSLMCFLWTVFHGNNPSSPRCAPRTGAGSMYEWRVIRPKQLKPHENIAIAFRLAGRKARYLALARDSR